MRISPRGGSRRWPVSPPGADAENPRIVLTTVNALLQRVPPPAAFAAKFLRFAPGDAVDMGALTGFLAANGYGRTATVMEPGEYALRGGLIDIFPPGADEPLRLDLFGDEIETVRRFDPLTQRTTGTRDAAVLMPAGELFLDPESIGRFRAGYRELFGAVSGDDPLFEAISAGLRHPGMEHWLPLFHDALVPLTDYLPGAVILLDTRAEEARDGRLDQIADHYGARLAAGKTGRAGRATAISQAPVYHPVPPERLYLDRASWERLLAAHPVGVFSPFDAPPAGGDRAPDFAGQGRKGRDFAEARARRDLDLFDAVRERVAEEHGTGRRVVVAAFSRGSRDRIAGLMGEHGIGPLASVEDWDAVRALPTGTVTIVVLGIENGFVTPDLAVICEQDILGERLGRPARRRTKASDQFIAETSALSAGDLVVHAEHGIGR
ncbi:MAG: transcription-repair coupling factor, partial [Alphaproteobacteria bacterium]